MDGNIIGLGYDDVKNVWEIALDSGKILVFRLEMKPREIQPKIELIVK